MNDRFHQCFLMKIFFHIMTQVRGIITTAFIRTDEVKPFYPEIYHYYLNYLKSDRDENDAQCRM